MVLRKVLVVAVVWFLALGLVTAHAQTTEEVLFEDTLSAAAEVPLDIPDDSTSTLAEDIRDTLMRLPAGYVPKVSMELLADRLGCIEGQIPLTLNNKVASFIDYFVVRNRRYTQMVLERKDFYFPIFEKYLKQYGLPDELKYLAIVESGLNHAAISRVGAVGLWQFMPVTGKECGLYLDHYFDERLEAERSTEAACKYLKRLYRVLGDWELVLASYNCGVGKVSRIVKATGKRNFWELYDRLPQETRAYVPQFVALSYAVNYHKEHNIFAHPDSLLEAIPYDTVVVQQQVNLHKLSALLGVEFKVMRHLNPTLRRYVTPAYQPVTLRIPSETKEFFALNRAELLDSAAAPVDESILPAYFRGKSAQRQLAMQQKAERKQRGKTGKTAPAAPAPVVSPEPLIAQAPAKPAADTAEPETGLVHKVEPGQGLYAVARAYKVTVEQLRDWNNLDLNQTIHVGQKLLVKVKTSANLPEALAMAAPAESEAAETKSSQKLSREDQRKPKIKGRTYRVQRGDTLWEICQRNELSVDELVKLNKLKNRKITPGQKLIVG